MQKTKLDIFRHNSKFYKLDFGIVDIENLDKTYLLIFFAILSGFSGIDISAKEEVLKVAHKIASKSSALARLAKETVNVSYETTLNEGLRAERAIFMSTFSLEDHKEGMEAFSEKRKPNWKNK